MFQDELLPGFDFLAPNELYDWSQQVFEGTDCNLFPNILITISIPRTGEQAGFLLTKENENFGVFSRYSPWRVGSGYWIWKIWRLARKLDERKTRGNLKNFE